MLKPYRPIKGAMSRSMLTGSIVGLITAASTAAADAGEAPAARTAESAETDTTGDTAVDPDGTGLRPGTDMARTAAGRPDLSARAGLTATPAADRTATDASPALPPPASASPASAPTTAPAMTDPRPVLAAQAGAPDGEVAAADAPLLHAAVAGKHRNAGAQRGAVGVDEAATVAGDAIGVGDDHAGARPCDFNQAIET